MRCLPSRTVMEKLLANGIVFGNGKGLDNGTTLGNINKNGVRPQERTHPFLLFILPKVWVLTTARLVIYTA